MSVENHYGTSLLAFNTKRDPDPDRGNDIKHFELKLPSHIKEEFDKWETGERPGFNPGIAAEMLWSTETALFLDGRLAAWQNVPGVKLLLPGWEILSEMPQASWPDDQRELQKFIAEAGSPGTNVADFLIQLKSPIPRGEMSASSFLNDLVLIFKYAAVGYQRPIHLAADLYRLSRTLLMDTKAPSNVEEIFGCLTAPLIVPYVFTTPPGRSGPRVPLQINDDNKPPVPRSVPGLVIDTKSPGFLKIVKRIEKDLDEIDKIEIDKSTIRALRNVVVDDPIAKASIIEAVHDSNDTSLSDDGNGIIRRVMPVSARRTSRKISRNIGGFPVLIDMAEIEMREHRQREEKTNALLGSLPDDIKSRIDALDNNLYVLEVTDEINRTLPHHPPPPAGPSFLKPAGRTDLLLVRQATIGYRRAEIAHVENVLIGETRHRDHTKRIFTRDELFESTEKESEETTDLQTTDSSDLSNEVNRVVSENLSAEGSVEVTYRGATKVVAKAAGAFEKSTENTARAAAEYATEIVDQAVTRIYERTIRETRSIFEQEIVEENRHHFERDGGADEHVSGVYQYLERVSKAKIFSYGERDLYDILVPEPATLIWNLATPSIEDSDPIDKPNEIYFNSITLSNIEGEREKIIREFQVIDFEAPPPLDASLDFPFSATGSGGNAKYVTNKELSVDDGYIIKTGLFHLSGEREDGYNVAGGFVIGSQSDTWEITSTSGVINEALLFSTPLKGPKVGIAINAENFQSLSGNITLKLERTEDRYKEWALEAYSRVATRFDQIQQDYELAVIRAEATQPEEEINLPSGARRRLKKMVRNELQRAAIGIMRNKPVNYDLINDVPPPWLHFPITDIPELKTKEAEIQFLQQAFEWEHLSWVLYPYFWGRRDGIPGWKNTVVQDHPDPDFSAFLNSGAARLQISVRPGFQDLVNHFMETGEVYEGNGLPKMGDPGYVPFIDEQINSLGGPGEEVQWPIDEPIEWDVVTPTPLVIVRKVAEKQLPTWDADTGDEEA